jgi:hypothetical protein
VLTLVANPELTMFAFTALTTSSVVRQRTITAGLRSMRPL